LLVVLSKTNYTTELVHASRTLSVTVLSEAQPGLLEPLGLRSGRSGPKLGGLKYELSEAGDPVFTGGARWVQGGVLDSFDLGDSTGFLVAVRTTVSESAAPMTWQTAKGMVGEEFLARWAEKSAREQEAARAAMTWREWCRLDGPRRPVAWRGGWPVADALSSLQSRATRIREVGSREEDVGLQEGFD